MMVQTYLGYVSKAVSPTPFQHLPLVQKCHNEYRLFSIVVLMNEFQYQYQVSAGVLFTFIRQIECILEV